MDLRVRSLLALPEGTAMTLPISRLKLGIYSMAAGLFLTGPLFALPGTSPANTRPKMPPKPPILGIPNGGRQAAFQEGHGAFGNAQGTGAGAAGQGGQFGQGGGFGGGAGGGLGGFGGGAGGGLGGGGLGGGAIGGGLGGGGMKGFGVGGGLLGPEPSYQGGVGIYGGTATLDGLTLGDDKRTASPAERSASGYNILMLSPVVSQTLDRR